MSAIDLCLVCTILVFVSMRSWMVVSLLMEHIMDLIRVRRSELLMVDDEGMHEHIAGGSHVMLLLGGGGPSRPCRV